MKRAILAGAVLCGFLAALQGSLPERLTGLMVVCLALLVAVETKKA